MFNFFKRYIKQEQQEEDIIASISYVVKHGQDGALIDIQLNDYDEKSVSALCNLLNILGNDVFYIDTISMIEEALIKDNREDILIKILANVSEIIKNKIAKDKIDNHDGPCIKPSDMLT